MIEMCSSVWKNCAVILVIFCIYNFKVFNLTEKTEEIVGDCVVPLDLFFLKKPFSLGLDQLSGSGK